MFGLYDYDDLQKLTTKSENAIPETDEEIVRSMYRSVARKRAEEAISGSMFNDTFRDSTDIYEAFFDFCNDNIRIIARGIKKDILCQESVLRSSLGFMKRSTQGLTLDLRARDGVEEDEVLNTKFVKNITYSTEAKKKFTINFHRPTKGTWLPSLGTLTMGDSKMYRYRYKQINNQYTDNAGATVDFNAPEKVNDYMERADQLLSAAQPIRTFVH